MLGVKVTSVVSVRLAGIESIELRTENSFSESLSTRTESTEKIVQPLFAISNGMETGWQYFVKRYNESLESASGAAGIALERLNDIIVSIRREAVCSSNRSALILEIPPCGL